MLELRTQIDLLSPYCEILSDDVVQDSMYTVILIFLFQDVMDEMYSRLRF